MKMTTATAYLKNHIECAYDPEFISTMDDLINADRIVEKVLKTTYTNADYDFLKAYAQTARDRLHDEIGF